MSLCLVIPHYNHSASFVDFLPRLRALNVPCIVVDDGSDADELAALKAALVDAADIEVMQHASNRGKGAAMVTGSERALARGFTHMLQIDADGQHDTNDIAKFRAMSEQHPHSIISGAPTFDDSAPKARVYGRKVTDFWVALETWTLTIEDSLCGFRIYPLAEFKQVERRFGIAPHMDFDTDVLVKSVWLDVPIRFIKTAVIYRPGNNSHFHYLRDNLRLIALHTRLMCGMLIRAPWWLVRGGARRIASLSR